MISSVSITVAITVVVLSLHLHLHHQPPPPPIHLTTNNVVVNETVTKSPTMKTKSNYIVRFNGYKNAQDHRLYLERSLDMVTGWSWVSRKNAAAAFPTDFGIVAIENGVESALKVELEKLGLVKDVNIDLSYDRSALRYTRNDYVRDREWKRERGKGRKKCGSFVDGKKRRGKIFTSMSFSEEDGEEHKEGYESEHVNSTISWRRKLMMQRSQITSMFGAEKLWRKGYTGVKVKMAVFDTGIRADHPHFRNIKERSNWTSENALNDSLGHGTFVAGVIASDDEECLGFAPDTEIYAFRVFTDAQVSYTSWFLDAFNYAIQTHMDVLNLSIGGPDYLDLPFVEKIWELTANNIIMVSAIGNDGPLYGTLNNPADQSDVIGVGGIDFYDHIASFSSRGMSTWEMPHGYGRVKPDIVAYGKEIKGSKTSTGCKTLSGTSVASPVVAGVVCLLVSVIPEKRRKDILNPASMKQILVEGAARLSGPHMYEQGAGRVDLLESYEILKIYTPRASIFPSILDYTDYSYSWPYSRQPLYAGAMPVMFNATILNGMGLTGYIEGQPEWHPNNDEGNLLSIHFTFSKILWPWTGHLGLHMQIKDEGANFSGLIEGNVTVTVFSPSPPGERGQRRTSTCVLQLKLKVIPTPPRAKRLLWDQYHSIKYPPGYIPRDSLEVRNDILDWHGDHLHTNYHVMFNMLIDWGYFVETLGSPLTCFDARQYGTLLMVDLEDEYYEEEIEKLRDDVLNTGLGLVVFAEWYNVDTMVKMRFFDDNTRSWWTPITGGANVPALNDLLASFGIAFGDKILNGDYYIDGEKSRYASGTDIVKFPEGGFIYSFPFLDSSESGATKNVLQKSGLLKADSPVLGLVELGDGRISVYGDSNCLDTSHMVVNCYWLLRKMLDFTSKNIKDPVLFSDSVRLKRPLYRAANQLPSRRTDVNFSFYSAVVGKELVCQSDSRSEVRGTRGYILQLIGRNRRLPGFPSINMGRGWNSTMGSRFGLDGSPKKNGRISFTTGNYEDTVDFLGWIKRDEFDMQLLLANQWFIPVIVTVLGLLLILTFWRLRKKQRWRRRSSTGRFTTA